MTSPIAPVNWTADGTDMVDVDGICLHQLVRGGPGETAMTRGEPDTIPALVGLQPRLYEKERRTIEFRGWVCGAGASETAKRTDYWDNRIALEALLDPTAFIVIEITLPGGAQYSITARPLPPIGYDEITPSIANCSVEFESFDPDWTAS